MFCTVLGKCASFPLFHPPMIYLRTYIRTICSYIIIPQSVSSAIIVLALLLLFWIESNKCSNTYTVKNPFLFTSLADVRGVGTIKGKLFHEMFTVTGSTFCRSTTKIPHNVVKYYYYVLLLLLLHTLSLIHI